MDSGLDVIKIAITGFTQEIYQVQHRNCQIEKVKNQLENDLKNKDTEKTLLEQTLKEKFSNQILAKDEQLKLKEEEIDT